MGRPQEKWTGEIIFIKHLSQLWMIVMNGYVPVFTPGVVVFSKYQD